MPMQNDLIVLASLLKEGPATSEQLARRIGLSERGMNYAAVRLLSQRMVAVVGYTGTRPGSRASHRARIFGAGPAIQEWAAANIKPTEENL